jgi:hypothetical protein
VVAVIQFTDLAKLIPISNPVQVKLNSYVNIRIALYVKY